MPPVPIVLPLSVPPDSVSKPPLTIVPLTAAPPVKTISCVPLEIVNDVAVPLFATSRIAPSTSVVPLRSVR